MFGTREWLIVVFVFIIQLIGTLAYSVRIVGVRTRKIAISFSLFNLMTLVSRTANSFLGPLLSKGIEQNISSGDYTGQSNLFRIILLVGTFAAAVGAMLIPTFQRMFGLAVLSFSRNKSILRLVRKTFTPVGFREISGSFAPPAIQALKDHDGRGPGRSIILPFLLNMVIVAALCVGSLASLYAAYRVPEFRTTANSLSAIVNGIATVLLFLFVDPYLAGMTDDVLEGKTGEGVFRRCVAWLVLARIAGTLLAQALLEPAAAVIAFVATRI